MNVAEFHQNIEQVWQKIEERVRESRLRCGLRNTRVRYSRSHLMTAHKSLSISKNRFLSFGLRAVWVDFILPIKNNDWVANDGKRFWDCLIEAVAAHGETVTF